jgi:hypothetical protein
MGFLDLAEKILGELQADLKLAEGRILDGHRVVRVIWETNNAVIFQDESGCFWRYLYSHRQAWPVIIGGMQGDNQGMESRDR